MPGFFKLQQTTKHQHTMKTLTLFYAFLLSIISYAQTPYDLAVQIDGHYYDIMKQLEYNEIEYTDEVMENNRVYFDDDHNFYVYIFEENKVCRLILIQPKTSGALHRKLESLNETAVIGNTKKEWFYYIKDRVIYVNTVYSSTSGYTQPVIALSFLE